MLEGEVVDSTVMRAAALDAFLAEQIARAKADDVLFSVHLKATMMKVSDPIIFGHVVRAFLPDVFATYGADLAAAGLSANNGLGSILDGLAALGDKGAEIKAAIDQGLADGPRLAMVNSDKGITNLHVPSDVIVDASMPAMIRTSGHMWGPDGAEADTLAVIPDSSYAGVYQAVIDDCRANGAYDPTTMGSVPNVGLMAQKAEEYGSHDKTFEIAEAGTVQVVNAAGEVLMAHDVAAGRHLARLPDQGRPDPRLGQARRHPGPRLRHPGRLLARRDPRPRPQPHREGRHLPRRPRHRGPRPAGPVPGRGRQAVGRADPQGRGHHLGHRQRAARLQHRPVPHPRARHQRQDALGRAADERRRPLRDRCRRLGAQARAAARPGELPALGQPGRVPGPGREPAPHGDHDRQRPRRVCSARPSTARPSGCSTRTRARRARSARSTTAAATSTWRSSGPTSSPPRPRTPSWPPSFAAVAETLAANESQINDELLAVQGHPADIGGYYRPDADKTAAVMRPSATFNEALASPALTHPPVCRVVSSMVTTRHTCARGGATRPNGPEWGVDPRGCNGHERLE